MHRRVRVPPGYGCMLHNNWDFEGHEVAGVERVVTLGDAG
jgi:hypothetical protein